MESRTSMNTNLPSPTQNPLSFLQAAGQFPPHRDIVTLLADPTLVAAVKQTGDPERAADYIFAVARHLPTESTRMTSVTDPKKQSSTGRARASRELEAHSPLSVIVNTVGHAVSQCTPRSRITESGILPVLASLIPSPSLVLTAVHVEFLQACIFAEQYRYAARVVGDSWPRPNARTTILQVLRYFYLRGTVHLACVSGGSTSANEKQWNQALRSFSTCLIIPAEAVSAIQIAAWKRLVLMRCLLHASLVDMEAEAVLAVPKVTSACLARLINAAILNTAEEEEGKRMNAEDTDIVHVVELIPQSSMDYGMESPSLPAVPKRGEDVCCYVRLVRAFLAVDRTLFNKILKEHESVYSRDGNLGLVHQCLDALLERQIYQLSSVYSSISLDRLGDIMQLDHDSLHRLLIHLSMDRGWAVDIRSGYVFFPALPPLPETGSTAEEVLQLAYMTRNLDASIASSAKFTQIRKKKESSAIPIADTTSAVRGYSRAMEEIRGPRGVEDI